MIKKRLGDLIVGDVFHSESYSDYSILTGRSATTVTYEVRSTLTNRLVEYRTENDLERIVMAI